MEDSEVRLLIENAAKTELTELDLAGNGLTELPISIATLVNLRRLNLFQNNVSSLPREIGLLYNLRDLFLFSNQLASLPVEIGQLSALQRLDLARNRISTLPAEIGFLSALELLELSNNRLSSLPQEIGQLTNLETLDLRGNQLTDLPPEIGQLSKLRILSLEDNPLIFPPPEIVKQGTQAVLAFLREQMNRSRRQWASKILLVGEGGVGKTSLLKALRGDAVQFQEPTTHGIEISQVALNHPTEPEITMRLNAWDFGGQEIYHATHQFFMTSRSLYLLLWNARLGFEQGRLYYWLDTIKAKAPESPILIVATHIDERSADIPIAELRDQYPQVIGHYTLSNKTGEGIDALRQKISDSAATLPLMGGSWPGTWLDAAEAIRGLQVNHVAPLDMYQLMKHRGVEGGDAKVLAQWLHDLGDILYFRDDDELNDTVILKPQWVSRYISAVLESKEVIHQNGLFTREHMQALWTDIPLRLQDHFIRLMEHFDLSYRTLDQKEVSLVVERLPRDPPDFETLWSRIQETEPCREISMHFCLNTIPPGIPTWFIARSHRFTTQTHWRNGALLADGPDRKHLALVRAVPYERYLELTVRGPSPHNFFELLKDGIEVTLNRFPGLKIDRLIPCQGHQGHPCSHKFRYEQILGRVENRPPRWEIECPESLEQISVSSLLFGVDLDWSIRGPVLEVIDETGEPDWANQGPLLKRFGNVSTVLRKLEDFAAEHLDVLETGISAHQAALGSVHQILSRNHEPELVSSDYHEASEEIILARLNELNEANSERHKELVANFQQYKELAETEAEHLRELIQRGFASAFRSEQEKEESHCPNVFAIFPTESNRWMERITGQKLTLHLYCQAPGAYHPTLSGGRYQIDQPAEWLAQTAPYLRYLAGVLKYTLPVIAPGLGVAIPNFEVMFKEQLDLMGQLMGKLPEFGDSLTAGLTGALGPEAQQSRAMGPALRALRQFLDDKDTAREWGFLNKKLTPEGHYLWLCEPHMAVYQT